jgi:chromosome partitioning protein
MQKIVIANLKGGTGKSATATALAQACAADSLDVLAIDLDPQANMSYNFAPLAMYSSYELITGQLPADRIVTDTRQRVDVIKASWELSTVTSERGSARRLQEAIRPLNYYDVIIIDTPPTTGELMYNALQAATELIIPVKSDVYNIQALEQMAAMAKSFQEKSNPDLKITGYILTQYDGRSTLCRQMKDLIERDAETLGLPCLGVVRQNIAIAEAAAMQTSLFEYAPQSKAAQDYKAIYNRIVKKPYEEGTL